MPIFFLKKTRVMARLDEMSAQLTRMEKYLVANTQLIMQEGEKNVKELQALQAQVAANKTVIESAITLIQGLAVQIQNNKNDPAALQALADSMKATDAGLADAILAGTTPTTPAP